MDVQGIILQLPVGMRNVSLLQDVQTGSDFHSAFFELGTEDLLRNVRGAEIDCDHSPLMPGIRISCAIRPRSHMPLHLVQE
jgi:hypothetical protein